MIWMLWHGGPSYTVGTIADDVEDFLNREEAVFEFVARENGDVYEYPCVTGSTAHVFLRDPRGETDPYPDFVWGFDATGKFEESPA